LQPDGWHGFLGPEVVRLLAKAERQRLQRIWKAMMLAPTLEVCEALLRGESVPLECLDGEWEARFGRTR
jgi:hypothetical protein